MKLLLTGGMGYLGSRLAQFISLQAGYEIVLGTRSEIMAPHWLPEVKVVQTRWSTASVLDEITSGVDTVIHLAGMNAQDCASDPAAAMEVNAVNTARLLQAAIRQGVKRFIYLSTAHVYGSPLAGVITEETCPASLHPYATSHRAGEDVVRAAHQGKSIEGVVIRLSNAFGAPAYIDANCWILLVNDLCRQSVTNHTMVLRSSGMQRRDFITLEDTCRAITHLQKLPVDKLGDGLFNVGGDWSPTILEMTQRVAERFQIITGIRPEILRKEADNSESTAVLKYGIKKLIDSGFKPKGNNNVDSELDGLIRFCLNHQSQSL